MKHARVVAVAIFVVLAILGCGSKRAKEAKKRDPQVVRDARISAAGPAFERYADADKASIRRGIVRVGLDEYGAYLAFGTPMLSWKTRVDDKTCNVLIEDARGTGSAAGTLVFACDGTITKIAPIEPAFSCWSAAAVGPRIAERLTYFETLPFARQWQLAAGQLERGQSSVDLYIAFGAPYRRGIEARADNTNVTTLVFLDNSGDAYGATVTLVDDKVVSWTIPAERVLTPEAIERQRQLAAQQEALAEQRAEMQRQNEERARAAQQQLQQQMQQQQQAPTPSDPGPSNVAPAPAGGGYVQNQTTTHVSGSKQLTLNGCAYTDSATGALGNGCTVGVKGCPGGYVCAILGSGSSGWCVPAAQNAACGHRR